MMSADEALYYALPQLQSAELALRQLAASQGITYGIADYGGLRTQADTSLIMQYRDDDYAKYSAAQKAAGKTAVDINTFRPIAPFGSSYHNYGAAFDVEIGSSPGTAGAALSILKAMAPRVGLRSAVANDPPHFELALPLSTVKQMWLDFTDPTAGDNEPESYDIGGSAITGITALVLFVGTASLLYWGIIRSAGK